MEVLGLIVILIIGIAQAMSLLVFGLVAILSLVLIVSTIKEIKIDI